MRKLNYAALDKAKDLLAKELGCTVQELTACYPDIPCQRAECLRLATLYRQQFKAGNGSKVEANTAPAVDSVLLEAEALTEGARNKAYGHPIDDYTRTAALWSVILGHEVTPEKAILCMVAVKISRECNSPKRDNRVDGAGYFKVLDMAINEAARRRGA